MIGILEGLLEIVIGENSNRPIALTKFKRKTDSAVFCASVGEAASQISAAKALIETMMREIDQILRERSQLDYKNRAAYRGFVALSARMLRLAADHLMDMLGSSGFAMAMPGQRYWRDYCTVARHVSYMPDVGMEVYGRQLLGFPIEDNVVAPATI
jgi:alkylation response protein AidB-like acyl-CoA dehydrogenase